MRGFKSDGNGGYVIQKGTFAAILCIIAFISCISTVVAYGASMRSDINYVKTEVERAATEHPQYQSMINGKISEHETAIVVNQEKILATDEDLDELKSYLKELLSK